MSRRWRPLAAILITALSWPVVHAQTAGTSAGQGIYRDGILPSGQPLKAERESGLRLEGQSAACVNCHRRSGLGMKEGRTIMPPVAGRYLFHPRAGTVDDLDLPFVEGMRPDRDPYSEETLARAIRSGIGVDGRPLYGLMPKYQLDDREMAALIGYLKSLAPFVMPGAQGNLLRFATIVTPDADPIKRDGVLQVLQKFFADKNHYVRSEGPRMRSSHRMMFKVNRHWQLSVWRLQGAPESWERQLQQKLAAEPVLAVISGIGGRNWAPVHRFCERAELPCLFPNAEVPVVSEHDFDNLYLSKGILLEAQLIGHAITAQAGGSPKGRIVQVFRADDVGVEAAAALSAALSKAGLQPASHAIPARAPASALRAALHAASPGDSLVLWLRPDDISALGAPPPGLPAVYVSGRMSGLERAPLPPAWRPLVHQAYPLDLPARRRVRLDYPLGWFRIRQIPVVALEEQADTYMVCGIVSDAINHMVDTFYRDYLVERIEAMLEHRIVTGYYPRLSLAPNERFASKGGYLVHFPDPSGTQVLPDGGWIVP